MAATWLISTRFCEVCLEKNKHFSSKKKSPSQGNAEFHLNKLPTRNLRIDCSSAQLHIRTHLPHQATSHHWKQLQTINWNYSRLGKSSLYHVIKSISLVSSNTVIVDVSLFYHNHSSHKKLRRRHPMASTTDPLRMLSECAAADQDDNPLPVRMAVSWGKA